MSAPEKKTSRRSGAHGNRVTEVIAHEAAQFIALEAGKESLVTVIRAERMRQGHIAVFISVFPEEKALAALAFLARKRESFSDYLKGRVRLGPLPRIDFLLDNREREEIEIK